MDADGHFKLYVSLKEEYTYTQIHTIHWQVTGEYEAHMSVSVHL